MRIFNWRPDNAILISESGLIASRVPYGDGYAQVSYKGIARSWEVVFCSLGDRELRLVYDFANSDEPFGWVQPSPHSSDGEQLTRARLTMSQETNGELIRLEYLFDVEIVGPQFAEQAGAKYGPRDTGTLRS